MVVVVARCRPAITRALPPPRPTNLYYQVETLVFGRAVERATQSRALHRRLRRSGHPLPPALQAFLDAFGCPILPMRYESAELAKIPSISAWSLGLGRQHAGRSLRGVGADWSEIVPALRLDRRIGPYSYLGAGPRHRRRQPRARPPTIHRHRRSARAPTSAWSAPGSVILGHRKDWALAGSRTGAGGGPRGPVRRRRSPYSASPTRKTPIRPRNPPALALLDHLRREDVTVGCMIPSFPPP